MRDRLLEMQEMSKIEEGQLATGSKSIRKLDDRKLPKQDTASRSNASFEQFLSKVELIRHSMISLNTDRDAIQRMQIDVLVSGGGDSMKTKELNNQVDRFIQRARQTREKLATANADLNDFPDQNCGSSRARHEQVRVLNMSFETIMMRFNEEQINYKGKASNKIAEYLRKQNIQVSESQIDEAIESGSLFQLTKNLHMGIEQKKALFEDVKTRASNIIVLEKQIREIEDLFHDMHLLVVSQGETLENIESSVQNATEYAIVAEKNVKDAVILRRRSNKCKILILVFIIFIIIFLLGIFKVSFCLYLPVC